MGTVSVIITIVSLLIIAASMLLGIRRGLWGTVIKIVSVFVTTLLAFLITRFIFSSSGSPLGGLIDLFTDYIPEDINKVIDSASSALSVAKSSVTAIISPFVFSVIFFILFFIMMIPEHFAKELIFKSKKGNIAGGVAASSVVGLILVFALLLPFAGLIRVSTVAKQNIDDISTETTEDIVEEYNKYLYPLYSNLFIRYTSIMSSPVYNGLSVIRTKDSSSSLYDAADVGSRLVADIIPLADVDKITKKEAEYIKRFADDFSKTEILPSFAGEILSSAAESWKKGDTFLDFSPEESLKAYDESGRFDELFGTVYDILEKSSSKTVKEDVVKVSYLVSLLAENDAFDITDENADIGEVLSRKGLISGVVELVYSYDRFRPLASDFLNIALDYAGEELGFDEQTKRNIRLTKDDMASLSEKEIKEESLRMENTVVQILGFVESVSKADVLDADIISLGSALDNASDSLILGSKVKLILEAVLKSEKMQSLKLFSKEVVDRMLAGKVSYEATFGAASKAIDIIKSIDAASVSGNNEDTAVTTESITWLVNNMDESVAEILSSAISPEFVEKCGVPGTSSEKVSELFSDYFDMLGHTEKLTKEKAADEANCLTAVYSVLISGVKGGVGSSSGKVIGGFIKNADNYVDMFMRSEIFSVSVVNSIYKNGTPTIDPFNIKSSLSSSDVLEITVALEKYFRSNYDSAEDKDEFCKKLISAGAVFGINITSIVNSKK